MLSGIDSIDNDSRVRVLGIIDKLRELGVSETVSLPQLVVVGDQSSGKSSLLEALTGLSFPIASDLCTRHATQIVLRRSKLEEAGAKISIIPGRAAQADEETKERLLSFERSLSLDQFGVGEFTRIFDEAAECMQVPGPTTENLENLKKRFSDDILKIELSGPGQKHLSVVDVPGLFHNPTKYQTTEDRFIIRSLIESYITDKRTIILAVMDARNNLANQEVFSMARAADPEGIRTVGIITKCDALEAGDEEGVIRIAKNMVERLHHGWFAVKNRSTKDIRDGVSIEERNIREKEFFSTEKPWTELASDRVGIDNVKSFLGRLLYNHIKGEFPSMVKEIEDQAQETQDNLELLGPSRQTSLEQRKVLLRIALTYQNDVTGALSGNYEQALSADRTLKLRLRIREINDEFADAMNRNGHARAFRTVQDEVDQEFYRPAGNGQDENIYDWIRMLYRDSRGVELPGTVNPMVLENMFRQQTVPWEGLAQQYFASIYEVLTAFNHKIFELKILDDDLKRNLMARLRELEMSAFGRAKDYLMQILRDEREGILQTVNNYFAETVSSIREDRVRARLSEMGLQDSSYTSTTLNQMMSRLHLSNEDQAVYDIHDTLKAYYKVALKRFADNVIIQVTERHLLGPQGPVRILSPEWIGDFSEAELADVASENFATSSSRNEQRAKLDRLQQALHIARQAGI
ncbi:P-loop containing nucleoside triphosphate hydrolase protein [Aspergillus uvarum CBS 121591]|uniref:P-loop containing nucleoside triphosphate hydrolase protein n=1 Tax=Aspergillus uvarum CBS 121591 TaxID=1448315 RepID=A0A319BVG9_9EURO|nr:P-loop containing nucleoside triphosphate hydrolase protein [Aspergillus uvarum CBS 121591]PYH75340.1 P-loop containing nucleoside triphosphate hydrolase protein [Aspergillus uvarum CBS 121591]